MSRMSGVSSERPIAVFDSGVGGLTVLHELLGAAAGGLPLPRRHTTGDVESFRALGTRFLQMPLGEVERVTLTPVEVPA